MYSPKKVYQFTGLFVIFGLFSVAFPLKISQNTNPPLTFDTSPKLQFNQAVSTSIPEAISGNTFYFPLVSAWTNLSQNPPTPVGQSNDWRLVFNDEFNGPYLNTAVWHTCFWWSTDTCTIESNNELELYNAGDVSVQNGYLRLQAQKRNMVGWNGQVYSFTSGMVMTGGRKGEKQPGFTFTYGYVEARAKVPAGQGLWPAIWMLPLSYNSRPEIDIMEILGHQTNVTHMNYHYVGGDNGTTWTGPDFSAGWHTFAIDWEPGALIWYVDGVEYYRFTNASAIASEPEYVLLNLAVGGDWPGAPNAATAFPSYFDIDYVRIWQK